MDDKYDSGTGAAARSARVDGKENKKETLQQSNRKKSQTRKGRAKKKLIEWEGIEDWSDNDDYYDDVDELYDDDVDDGMEDDETMDDDVLSEKGLNDEETDSIDSWKMTEKPLDESEDFDRRNLLHRHQNHRCRNLDWDILDPLCRRSLHYCSHSRQ